MAQVALSEKGGKSIKEIGAYLVIDPEICHGQMTFKGTRIPVSAVLDYLARGYPVEQLVQSWPELSLDAVREAVILAAEALQDRYTHGARTAQTMATT